MAGWEDGWLLLAHLQVSFEKYITEGSGLVGEGRSRLGLCNMLPLFPLTGGNLHDCDALQPKFKIKQNGTLVDRKKEVSIRLSGVLEARTAHEMRCAKKGGTMKTPCSCRDPK